MAMRLPPDFSEFLRLLDVHDVDYLLVGGYAVAYHGYPRGTQDLDVWIDRRPQVAERIITALREFGFDDPALDASLFLDPDRLIRLGHPPMRLEILTSVTGLEFADSYRSALHTVIEGVPVVVISLADLRKNKRAAGRAKDLADLEELPET